jgi:hypothetical protein
MSRATGVIKKIDAALKRLDPNDKLLYKRLNVKTGGDALTGRGVVATFTDTLLDPQPMYQRLGRNVVGDSAPAQQIMAATGVNRIGAEYQIIFSSSCITVAELNNDNITFAFKDTSGNTEIYHLTDYEPVALTSLDLIFIGYIRSAVR